MITVKDKSGLEVYSGETPATIDVRSGAGYFKKELYTISLKKAGFSDNFEQIEFKISGWYWLNIVGTGSIGFFIADPASGKMFTPKKDVINVKLAPSTASNEAKKIKVYTLETMPKEWEGNLIEVTEFTK
jgi:hypothetical protein